METAYLNVLKRALQDGSPRACRNGETRAIFAVQMRHRLSDGFPLLTTKEVPWRIIVAELLWFIEGGRHSPVPFRMSNDRFRELLGKKPGQPTIWSHDSGKKDWLARGARFPGDCGRIYGSQWRNWNGVVDQLDNLIRLIKTDPASRYQKVVAWNPAELAEMCLPPCHGDFQCFVRLGAAGEKFLSLHMNQRSCDLFLGVPFNIASYGFLLLMLSQVTACTPDELVITLNDAHLYEAHVEAAKKQLARVPGPLPVARLDATVGEIDGFRPDHFSVLDYTPAPKIEAPLL